MAYSFTQLKKEIDSVKEWLSKELGAIHTGRASIAFLDGIKIESYGAFMPIVQVASLTIEDAKTLRVSTWDKGSIAPIDKAIREANLGVSVAADDKGLRVIFPELTTETREKYVKIAKKKLEEARISLRGAREGIWTDIQQKEKDGDMSEDDKFRSKEEMEKIIKEGNDALDDILKAKEKEILG